MASKGIWQAKIEKSKDYTIVQREGTYVEFKNLNSNIVAFVDEECLLEGTADPIKTLRETKWIIIDQIVWDSLLWQYRKDSKKDTFGDSEFFKKIQPHIIKQYNGSKISVKGSDIKDISAGNTYLLIPYSIYPEKRYVQQSIRLVYLKEPYVRYVYIDPPKMQEADIPPGYDSKLHLYGMYANLHLSTHILPDFRRKGKTSFDKVSCKINGVVFFINQSNEEVTVDNFETVLEAGENNYNSYKDLKIYIDPNWRNSEGTHAKDHQPQKYFIKIFASEIVTSTALNFSNPLGQNDNIKNLFNPIIYNTNTDFQTWYRFDKEDERWIALDMQPHIEVRWDTMEMIFKQLEIAKNNQIQYIGDIKYTKKEFDPCGYSCITIKDEDNKKRSPLVIFDEDQTIIDNTEKFFEITTGEKSRKISITLGNLRNQGVYCQGLLLGQGQKHDDETNVFQVERAVYSALRDSKGYTTEKDKTHKEQLEHARTTITNDNKTDYDVIKNEDNSKIKIVNAVLQWKENEDYSFEGNDKINLNLKYKYIKLLTIANDEFDPNFVGNLFEEAWLFNYLSLKYEEHRQLYYLPISTCRYPNQIAKINVLPDIKWTLLFKFNFAEADFQKFKEEHTYQVHGFLAHSSQTTRATTPNGTTTTHRSSTAAGISFSRTKKKKKVEKKGGIKKLIELLKRVEVSLTAEWKDETGKKREKDVIEGFLKQIYNFFAKISDVATLVGSLTEGDTNEEDKKNKKQLDTEIDKILGGRSLDGAWDILTKKPQETEIIYPSIALSASWFYNDVDTLVNPEFAGRKALEIAVKLKADPVVGVEITWSLLQMIARRHPIAFLIVKAVELINYLRNPSNKIDVTFKIEGKIGLEANFTHNMLSGNAYSNGKSNEKQDMISGTETVTATLEGTIVSYTTTYMVISEFNIGGEAKIGVKAEVGGKVYLGADPDGIFLSNQIFFNGFTFYMEAEAKLELTLFGVKIIDWNPKYDPEPLTWGKCSLDWMKIYLNNPKKKTEFLKFNNGEDE